MKVNNSLADKSNLKTGDILLCHKANDYVAGKIEKVTKSKYCHAAIFYGDSHVAESLALDGLKKGKVCKTNIQDLINRYDHVAVLRQPDAWATPDRINALKSFIDKIIAREVKYNLKGIYRFVKRKKLHENSIHDKLNTFFNGELRVFLPEKSNYFCSEFVCDCFISTGFIEPSAAVLYQADTYSPGDLGKDPTFGTFWGYLAHSQHYKVPEDDVFYQQSTFDDIFLNNK